METLIRDLPAGRYGIGCPAKFFYPRTWEEFDREIRLRNVLPFLWTRPAAIYYVGVHGTCEFEIDEPGKDTLTLDGYIGSGQLGAIPIELVEFNGAHEGG